MDKTTCLELNLTSRASSQTNSEPQKAAHTIFLTTKQVNAMQGWLEEEEPKEVQHETSCAVTTIHRSWDLYREKAKNDALGQT